jgi:ClpP class serine protease
VYIDGVAASIASLIAMAGDTIIMSESAMMMVHAPWASATGTADELRDTADVLEQWGEAMLSIYSSREKVSEDWVNAALGGGDTWLSASDAIELGLVDIVEMSSKMAAMTANHFGIKERESMELKEDFRARAAEIYSRFAPFMHIDGIPELYAEAAADIDRPVDKVTKDLLAKLGENAEPIAKAVEPEPVKEKPTFENLVAALRENGSSYAQAVRQVAAENADLHAEYIDRINGGTK